MQNIIINSGQFGSHNRLVALYIYVIIFVETNGKDKTERFGTCRLTKFTGKAVVVGTAGAVIVFTWSSSI